ncbi:hypothetical protein Anapl_09492, partial [Anas platyrhynchos]
GKGKQQRRSAAPFLIAFPSLIA